MLLVMVLMATDVFDKHKHMPVLQRCSQVILGTCVDAELYSCFSSSVGHCARWFTGCQCHDWLRKQRISPKRKQMLFRESVNFTHCECWRRGRRGSELSRGAVAALLSSVRSCCSERLHRLLARLPEADRNAKLHVLSSLQESWCEEIGHKLGFWRRIPWLLLGLWPQDSETGRIASEACEQWDEVVRSGRALSAHRVSYRMLHPGAHNAMAGMIRMAARTGVAHAELLAEVKSMNFLPACEQAGEGVHAAVFMANVFHGRNKQPPAICASLALPRNMALLHQWPRMVMASAVWNKRLFRSLLSFCDVSKEFVRHAESRAITQTLYHCHPLQLYAEMHESQQTLQAWNKLSKPEMQAAHSAEKLLLEFLRNRLRPDVLRSLPKGVGLQAPQLAPPGPGTLLRLATEAVAQAPERPETETIGLKHKDHLFFKVVKSDYTRRFTLGGDTAQSASIAGTMLKLVGRAGRAGIFQATGAITRVNMLELLRKHGAASLLQDLVVWRVVKTSMLTVRLPAICGMNLRALEWKQALRGVIKMIYVCLACPWASEF